MDGKNVGLAHWQNVPGIARRVERAGAYRELKEMWLSSNIRKGGQSIDQNIQKDNHQEEINKQESSTHKGDMK